MHSALYQGTIRHNRCWPKKHSFTYTLFMVYLDLAEIGDIFTHIPLWRDDGGKSLAYYNRNDYLRPIHKPIEQVVKQTVYEQTKCHHDGPIRMLTQLRMLGACFNPVTFYYCYNKMHDQLDYVLVDITNTPWLERHQYVVDVRKHHRFAKQFHISPFMDMQIDYDWSFRKPSEVLEIDMRLHKNTCIFTAHLSMERKAITSSSMLKTLFTMGGMTYKIVAGIYWQALKLYMKGVPFHAHPKSK